MKKAKIPNRPKRAPGRPPLDAPERAEGELWVVEWVYALGETPASVSRATGANQGYFTSLKKGEKTNPSQNWLKKVANYLEIPVHYFYQRPPEPGAFGMIDSKTLSRLR